MLISRAQSTVTTHAVGKKLRTPVFFFFLAKSSNQCYDESLSELTCLESGHS